MARPSEGESRLHDAASDGLSSRSDEESVPPSSCTSRLPSRDFRGAQQADMQAVLARGLSNWSVEWEEDTANCGVCNARFGDSMRTALRHHCRICGKCVCGGCSKSSLQLRDSKQAQRACTVCAAGVLHAFSTKGRLQRIGSRLSLLCRGEASDHDVQDLEQATDYCEGAFALAEEALKDEKARLQVLEDKIANEQVARRRLEAELLQAKLYILQIGTRFNDSNGADTTVVQQSCGTREAMAFCEAAFERFKTSTQKGRRSRSAPLRPTRDRECETSVKDSVASDVAASKLRQASVANTSNCAVCSSALGKRWLRPRHHCRICGRCVCSACSPNSIQLEGQKQLQRVCTPCASSAQCAPTLAVRLLRLSRRMSAVTGGDGCDSATRVSTPVGMQTLMQAVAMCEAALAPLEPPRQEAQASIPGR
mmetsp:Transcript_85570/g.238890  ORF Transcript_85570/g.238890 Transcript_85570/m.238890 type:complete len:424 (-) Transcript_85570:246-1517(-)